MIYSLEEIKHKTTPIFEAYGVEKAYLFGSYAKNQATEHSDIDILIDKGNIKTLFEFSGLQIALMETLNKDVDIITNESLNKKTTHQNDDHFNHNIEEEKVLFYG